ncbi:leucine-rich repeat serine/threonine-protein kinase 1-like [Boleophthalmus pectinirostris]|uniref:leucine-rich repeat serine/threonine-protein kinase 1-like n=1 Tax=Boleophthalmus pectinirostris TaxID=150288 RepID=UPI002432991F|nr:leucine-rich repeat serine/threonine-protein kinase 1-like [Boleophthalmus pectinirostris]
MSYWCVKGALEPGPSAVKMQQDSPGEDKEPPPASEPEHGSTLVASVTLEKIRSTYESGEREEAQELVQQACCQECSAGEPRIDGVDLLCLAVEHEDHESARYLLKEAHVSVPVDSTDDHPALVAGRHGHMGLVRLLLDSLPQTQPVPSVPAQNTSPVCPHSRRDGRWTRRAHTMAAAVGCVILSSLFPLAGPKPGAVTSDFFLKV